MVFFSDLLQPTSGRRCCLLAPPEVWRHLLLHAADFRTAGEARARWDAAYFDERQVKIDQADRIHRLLRLKWPAVSTPRRTRRTHIHSVYEKLHVQSRTEAVVKFLGQG